jgi:hypothetical protein
VSTKIIDIPTWGAETNRLFIGDATRRMVDRLGGYEDRCVHGRGLDIECQTCMLWSIALQNARYEPRRMLWRF